MAEYGFQSVASDGLAQIDGIYKNYVLWFSGSVPKSSKVLVHEEWSCVSFDWYKATIIFPSPVAEPPMIALHCNDGAALHRYLTDAQGLFTGAEIKVGPLSFTDYALYLPSNYFTPTDTWGLQVFGQDGAQVFHSGLTYMDVIDVVTLTQGFRGTFNHAWVLKPYYLVGSYYGSSGLYDYLGVTYLSYTSGDLNVIPNYNQWIASGCLRPSWRELPQHKIVVCKV